MIRNFLKILLGLAVLVAVSCNKDEGVGGEGSVKGKVSLIRMEKNSKTILDTIPASDYDVYIIYGNKSTVGDRVRTGMDGSYEFEYLLDGNYTVYAYSDDTTTLKDTTSSYLKPLIIKKNVNISGGKSVTAESIFVYDGRDIEDGSSSIKGKVYVYNYDKYGIELQSEYWGQDVEVYLIYASDSLKTNYDIRVRTSYDGSFEFPKLIKGKYKVFVYTAHTDANGDFDGKKEDGIILKTVTIDKDYTTVDLGTLKTNKL